MRGWETLFCLHLSDFLLFSKSSRKRGLVKYSREVSDYVLVTDPFLLFPLGKHEIHIRMSNAHIKNPNKKNTWGFKASGKKVKQVTREKAR